MTTGAAISMDDYGPSTPSVSRLFLAALDLRAFTGNVGARQLHALLSGAGVDRRWLAGKRWKVLEDLWLGNASAAEASRAIDAISS